MDAERLAEASVQLHAHLKTTSTALLVVDWAYSPLLIIGRLVSNFNRPEDRKRTTIDDRSS